jgi:hypothetical protein
MKPQVGLSGGVIEEKGIVNVGVRSTTLTQPMVFRRCGNDSNVGKGLSRRSMGRMWGTRPKSLATDNGRFGHCECTENLEFFIFGIGLDGSGRR